MKPHRLRAGLLIALLAPGLQPFAQAPALRIDDDRVGISKAIPKVGDEVVFRVPVTNPTDQARAGQYVLRARAAHDTGRESGFAEQEIRLELEADESRDVELAWQPPETGLYRITFELSEDRSAAGAGLRRAEFGPVAVTARALYFAWFGTPTEFRWCNVPTTVKNDDIEYWLRRGAIPCQWRGGVCYKEWSKEKLVENWASSQWIAIDEIGGPGDHTTRFMEALAEIKSAHPDHFVAVWFMGAHDYWADVKDRIDLFLPELYLNYHGNHLGQFDSYLDAIRRTGTISQTLFGLGINIVRDKETNEPKTVPTKEDVLRQIRHIKRIAPDMPGIAFFTSYSAAPGVAEYADELCGEYFVKPLATIVGERVEIDAGKPPQARVTVGNYGGMTARKIEVRLRQTGPDNRAHVDSAKTIKQLPVGEAAEVTVSLSRQPGIHTVTAEIAASDQYTILDGAARELVCAPDLLPGDRAEALAIVYLPPWDGGDRENVPVSWHLDGPVAPIHVVELAPSGAPETTARALASVGQAGSTARWVAGGITEAGQTRLFALMPGEPPASADAPVLRYEQMGDAFRIGGPHYSADLDAATDQIVSLKPADSDTELLKAPWGLHCTGHEGTKPAEVTQSGGWLAITVPFESAEAQGESSYIFSADCPAIEASRRFRPKGQLNVQGASDRCGLEQRGGTYACQPGVGGPVRRGALEDTQDYRDIYFGYLGGPPTEANAGKSGWLDFSWEKGWNAGLGFAIAERWQDARFRSYDVTRLYDASDWLEITYVWGIGTALEREQVCRHFLVPHAALDMRDENAVPPAQAVWETVQQPVRAVGLLSR